jgi:hypothetical protein
MSKRISLLGFVLMAMALPLYADISNPGHFTLDHPPAAPHLQIASSLITGTGAFSILDTRRQLNPEYGGGNVISNLTPAFKASNPVAPVPEPMHYALMGLGVIGLLLARRDRLNAK